MTIFTRDRVRRSFLEEFTAPLGDVLAERASEALTYSPTDSLRRMLELRNAERGEPVGIGGFDEGMGEVRPTSPMVDAEAARARVEEEGVDLVVPQAGIRKEALDILIERKKEERRRQDVFNRAPSGFASGALQIGAALGASALDPLNVASAFIPVVGPARYAMMLERAGGPLGRLAVRARVGALEGTVGAAVVEPIVATAAAQEQSDYGLVDSLLNVALGTALGGGLHVGAGAVGDAMAKGVPWQRARAVDPLPRLLEQAGPGTREAALRTAIAQSAEGRNVDVMPVLRSLPETMERIGGFRVEALAQRAETEKAVNALSAELAARDVASRQIETLRAEVTRLPDEIAAVRARSEAEAPVADADARSRLAGEEKALTSRLTRKQKELKAAEARVAGGEQAAGIADLEQRLNTERQRGAAREAEIVDAASRAIAEIAGDGLPRAEVEALVRSLLDAGEADADRVLRGISETLTRAAGARPDADATIAAARAASSPEAVSLADFQASKGAVEDIRAAPADDALPEVTLAEVMEDIQRLAAQTGDAELVGRELAEFDELQLTAEAYGKAVIAAASCGLRRGS